MRTSRFSDEQIIGIIRVKLWLKTPVEAADPDGTRRLTGGKHRRCGVPQGGVVSPMLANRYMNLWESTGDDQHDGLYYRSGAASCFFPVAARELVKDGLDPKHVAQFCVEAAAEALMTGGMPLKEAEDLLLRIVLANRISEEVSGEAA